ncbi:MAG: trypsin-like peptidase domain-containing protein, partial [Bacteroidales bacterium]
RTYDGKIIGTDQGTDLALIKIEEKDLPYLAYGNSDSVKLGEWVLAVGNPFNLTSTVTAGIISAKARNLNILGKNSSIESFLQTDAVINPGNSGGALVNTSGQLVGINAAIASNTGSYAGYSFAIPVNIVKKVVNDLLQYEASITLKNKNGGIDLVKKDDSNIIATLGATFETISSYDMKALGIEYGLKISKLEEGLFRSAGIREGFIVTEVDKKPVKTIDDLKTALENKKGGVLIVGIYPNGMRAYYGFGM